jgi:hypothetical protein
MTQSRPSPYSTPPAAKGKGTPIIQELAARLAQFDPKRHGGEAMVHAPVGAEAGAPSQPITSTKLLGGRFVGTEDAED